MHHLKSTTVASHPTPSGLGGFHLMTNKVELASEHCSCELSRDCCAAKGLPCCNNATDQLMAHQACSLNIDQNCIPCPKLSVCFNNTTLEGPIQDLQHQFVGG